MQRTFFRPKLPIAAATRDSKTSAFPTTRVVFLALLASCVTAACGGGGGENPGFSVGGTITGLSGSGLILFGLGNDLSVSGSSFTFANTLTNGTVYSVTVNTQPTKPNQTCVAENGTGTIADHNVTSITINCTTNTYAVGGSVSGLTGAGLVLSDGAGANVSVPPTDTAFHFPSVASGVAYNVTVSTQPASQTCTVTSGATGTVTSADISSVAVTCVAAASVNVSGLTGTGLVLQNHSTDDLAVIRNGSARFKASTRDYAVSVKSQPMTPAQTCVVASGASVTCTASPGRFAYVAAGADGIYCYAIDALNGGLANLAGNKPCLSPGALKTYSGLAVAPSGKFLYATDGLTGIGVYAINGSNGSLTYASSTGTGTSSADATIVDPSGAFLYVIENNAQQVLPAAISAATGGLTALTGSPLAPSGSNSGAATSITVDPTDHFLYAAGGVGGVSGYVIDGNSGALTPIAGSPFSATSNASTSVAVDPTGKFAYVTNSSSNTVCAYAINPSTGALTPAAGSPVATGTTPSGIAVDPSGAFVYVSNAGSNTVSAYAVNSSTGTLITLQGSPFTVGSKPSAVVVHPSGKFIYITNGGVGTVSAFAIDSATGVLTAISGSPFVASDDANSGALAIAY